MKEQSTYQITVKKIQLFLIQSDKNVFFLLLITILCFNNKETKCILLDSYNSIQ